MRKRFGAGSKSDREAVVLRTESDELVLRREGGNAFSDPQLDGLVGHRIRGIGHRAGYTLILKNWEDVPPSPPRAARHTKAR